MQQFQKPPHHLTHVLTGILLLFALTFVFKGELHLWQHSGPFLLPFIYWRRILLGAGLLLILHAIWRRSSISIPVIGTALSGMLVVFCSDWLNNPYSLLGGPSIRGEIVLGSITSFFLLRKNKQVAFLFIGPVVAIGLLGIFLYATHGQILFSDDHPVFLQRLILLKENFPAIPFYNPLWNAGIDQRDFFATGSLSVFLILAPLIYALDITTYYTFFVSVLLFLLIPSAVALASYRQQHSLLQASIAAVLTLTNSLVWYRWALKYGTLGFLLSAALAPLVLSLTIHYLKKDSVLKIKEHLALIIVTTLMLLWSPTALVFVPVALYGLFCLRHLASNRHKLITLLLIMFINIGWGAIFVSVSKVGSYVSKETTSSRRVAYSRHKIRENLPLIQRIENGLAAAHKIIRDWATPENPLILILILPSLLLMPLRSRVFFAATILWIVVLSTIGSLYFPQLELDRMLLIAGLLAVVPISALLTRIITEFANRSAARTVLPSLCLGFFLAAPFSTASIFLNRTVEHYQVAEAIVGDLAAAIKKWGGNGRVVFSGFILHELNGGHVAPLVFWSDKQLVASSHVHDKWWYTDVIPESYAKRGREGFEEFFELMNASAVVAHERSWIRYFRRHADQYREVWHQDKFYIFRRKRTSPSFFISGAGKISSVTSNQVTVILNTPEVVLKYRFYPFLKATACTLSEHPAQELSFIKLSNCPLNQKIVISAQHPWHRIGG